MSKFTEFKIIDNYIGCLTLTRSPLNALSSDFLIDITNKINEIASKSDCRILIINSSLDNFSVGADLKERKIMSKSQSEEALNIFNDCFNTIEDLEIPTICLINGYCLGGGTELSLSCDFRIGSMDSIIGLPEIFFPNAIGNFVSFLLKSELSKISLR